MEIGEFPVTFYGNDEIVAQNRHPELLNDSPGVQRNQRIKMIGQNQLRLCRNY